ncbi:MAG: hypothetical protein IKX15_05340, partial [Spirochaetales bacterium]|nr:hypothetical protein [Spirochaetales bacterium]
GKLSNLKYVGISNAQTISDGAFKDYPVELIDISSSVKSIGKNAFNSATKLRMPRGSYAESWAKQNGYYLCGTLADLSTYTKDRSLKIDENFTRIMCDSETPADLGKYKFKVNQPLVLNVVQNRLELTSYMLCPCSNVKIIKIGTDGKETVAAKYSKVQPLARYVVIGNVDSSSTYRVTADDDFYRSLTDIPVDWEVSFPATLGEYYDGFDDINASIAREWISLITQAACITGSSSFADYFLSSHQRFYSKKEMLTDKDIQKTYQRVMKQQKELGVATDSKSYPIFGIYDAPGFGLLQQYFGNQYNDDNWFILGTAKNSRIKSNANWFVCIASGIMLNANYTPGSNLSDMTGHSILFTDEFGYIARQFKTQGLLPYDDEHILSTMIFK